LTPLLICFALAGCELVADFDRSKIPQTRMDAGHRSDAGRGPDSQVSDAASMLDAAATDDDGGQDAGR
jgi:hypothetical protein